MGTTTGPISRTDRQTGGEIGYLEEEARWGGGTHRPRITCVSIACKCCPIFLFLFIAHYIVPTKPETRVIDTLLHAYSMTYLWAVKLY